MKDLPKAYLPAEHEEATRALWDTAGYATPEKLPGNRPEAYTVVMPPPNVTGTLHLGHAVMLAVEDLMIRFERMRGKKTLWVPGTDHAAIATQTKVEKMLLEKEKKSRHDYGREAFLEKVKKFAADSHDTIVHQVKMMGSSCDWSREAYTFDDERNEAVRHMFVKMFNDGLIYRGTRVVNWDPEFQTTLADDEVMTKETTANLYTFTYSKDFPIAISSTRPETKYGDTAVAVNPKDKRYAAFVGKTYQVEFCGNPLSIQVVADDSVDMEFGTGALGVTPAHSKIDEEISKRHGLPTVQVIEKTGNMKADLKNVGGLSVKEARKRTVELLEAAGLLKETKEVAQALPVSQRGGGVVEELPMLQWFIDVNKKIPGRGKSLKELSLEVVRNKSVQIVPDRFEKVYFHWMENLRDWCISRQIWFGHQIPVWYRGEEMVCAVEAPKGEGWVQDPDSLDTWFSSGLWTFSTLGWPKETPDLKTFHPTAVLETGYDILFFWVARMILMTTYALNQVPFRTVYLHGLVRDEQGRKMSKSLGNIIDPLDMIAKYGTDATRLALVIGSSPGNDTKLSETKIESFRNFANKLWNISRFIITQGENSGTPQAVTLADHWLLGRLKQLIAQTTEHLEQFRYSQAGEALRDFTWFDFADWYLEIAKVQVKDEKTRASTTANLHLGLTTLLKLWHPFMPFVTETIWQQAGFGDDKAQLMIANWPSVTEVPATQDAPEFAQLQELVVALRNVRAESKIPAGKKLTAHVPEAARAHQEVLMLLANLEAVHYTPAPAEAKKAVVAWGEIGLITASALDPAAEKARLEKEIAELTKYVEVQRGKLANADFVARAPEAVITKERAKLAEAEEKVKALHKTLSEIA